jgi:hypothetical protein
MKDKREVFKQFKQEKVFTKFCINVATVFDKSAKPRDSKNDYINTVLLSEYSNVDAYINSVKKWAVPIPIIKIMQ